MEFLAGHLLRYTATNTKKKKKRHHNLEFCDHTDQNITRFNLFVFKCYHGLISRSLTLVDSLN